jgi:hypothetical protein
LLSSNISSINVNNFYSLLYFFSFFSTLKVLPVPAFATLDIFGTLAQIPLQQLRAELNTRIHLNIFPFSNIARPTIGIQRTSIWDLRTLL